MKEKIKQRLLEILSWDEKQLDAFIHATPDTALHDPFFYTNMSQLVDELHAFKQLQDKHPEKLVVIDTDYDTDGVMSAAVLTAAFSCFNINHRIYIPSMKDGYGLNPKAIDDMLHMYPDVSLIFTADNGTNAYDGIQYANQKGIPVLVTDHHIGATKMASAKVVVNPNTPIDFYPFKGNAGATVAWKAMMAYAKRYAPEKEKYIYRLIVFAGIANVADVMPIIDENHFMVKEAVYHLKRIQEGERLPLTGITGYDNVMQGLQDVIHQMQTLRDEKRKQLGKKPSPLPQDEQLISWYLSPLLNAPRRVVGTPEAAFKGLLHANPQTRTQYIQALVALNEEKSQLRDQAIRSVNPADIKANSNVITIHAPHGIAGLVASHFANQTKHPTIVFAVPKHCTKDNIISGSARSNEYAPLPLIIEKIRQYAPEITIRGGGHSQAAGYAIAYHQLEQFKQLFDRCAFEVMDSLVIEVLDEPILCNRLTFVWQDCQDTKESLYYNLTTGNNLSSQLLSVIDFLDELKPFGKGFDMEPQFIFVLDTKEIQKHKLNLDFWQTFKVTIHGADVLTFHKPLADHVKKAIADQEQLQILCRCEVKRNEFLGKVTPQLILTPLESD